MPAPRALSHPAVQGRRADLAGRAVLLRRTMRPRRRADHDPARRGARGPRRSPRSWTLARKPSRGPGPPRAAHASAEGQPPATVRSARSIRTARGAASRPRKLTVGRAGRTPRQGKIHPTRLEPREVPASRFSRRMWLTKCRFARSVAASSRKRRLRVRHWRGTWPRLPWAGAALVPLAVGRCHGSDARRLGWHCRAGARAGGCRGRAGLGVRAQRGSATRLPAHSPDADAAGPVDVPRRPRPTDSGSEITATRCEVGLTGMRRSIDPARLHQDPPEWSSIADDRRRQHPVS